MSSLAVILVNYKTLTHTIECIESILQSNFDGTLRVIVVDNNSRDNCKDIISTKFKNEFVDVIENDSNDGFAKANNIGIDYAKQQGCDFVLLLNNDTVVETNAIGTLIEAYYKYESKLGIVTGKIKNYYDRNILWYAGGKISHFKGDAKIYGFSCKDMGEWDKEMLVDFASGCCMLMKTEFAYNNKMSEDYFLYYEDVDLCERIRKKKYSVLYCPEAVIYHKESVSTHKKSNSYSYYFARNRLTYIDRNMHGTDKCVSKIYSYLWLIKKVVFNELQFKGIISGIFDYRRKKFGEKIG